ncbi:Transmembrane protein 45A [Myotis brandtii]|uniref:Transmembrane protein 45A n=1 Tax=Myotis brandtii TaxID=109478 RepID=S7MJR1_MYOBR|nr:Transmembrane protein 45A [Myotis brandtii]
MGIWWTLKCILKYVCRKHKRTSYFGSKAVFYRIDIVEGIVIICMAVIGMLGEQFIPGGPHLSLYNYKEGQWVQLLGWHHTTMYFFFGLTGVMSILCSTIRSLPTSLSKLMLSNALFVEAFIFYNHTHGREILDIFVHQLLVLVIFLAGLTAFMELFLRSNLTVELLRTSFILLQGSWFWQIGFLKVRFCTCFYKDPDTMFYDGLVKSRLNRTCPSEVGLLKNVEREQESEEEM